jgi:hypothetical protein
MLSPYLWPNLLTVERYGWLLDYKYQVGILGPNQTGGGGVLTSFSFPTELAFFPHLQYIIITI